MNHLNWNPLKCTSVLLIRPQPDKIIQDPNLFYSFDLIRESSRYMACEFWLQLERTLRSNLVPKTIKDHNNILKVRTNFNWTIKATEQSYTVVCQTLTACGRQLYFFRLIIWLLAHSFHTWVGVCRREEVGVIIVWEIVLPSVVDKITILRHLCRN